MATDRTIEIRITAKNMSEAELAKARQAIAGFKRDTEGASGAASGLGGALRNASSLAGAFGLSLGVAGVVKFGKALLDDADALVKLADKTGMTTDAVQELKYIADQSGNTLEQLTGAVSMLQKRLANGDDSAIGALRGLGMEIEAFQRLDPDEQFMAIAREVAKIEDPMQRVKVATDLFGRSGAEVIPSLIAKVDELADAAPKMSAKAVAAFDSIGDGLSDLWARTKNAVGEGIAAMLDGYGRLASGLKALFSGDVSGALEIFTDLAETELPKVAGAANLVHPPLKAIALAEADVKDIEEALEGTRKRKIATDKVYEDQQEKIAAALEKIGFTTRGAVKEELALYEAMLRQQPTIGGINDVQIIYLDQLEELAVRAHRAGLVIPELTSALEGARLVAEHAGDGFIEWEQSLPLAPLADLIDLTSTQTETLDLQAVQARLLTDAYHEFGLKTPEELRRVASEAEVNYRRIADAVGAAAPEAVAAYQQMIDAQIAAGGELPKSWTTSIVPGITSALGTLQTAISGTFAQMMLGAKGFHDGFADIWSSLKATALRIFAEIADSFVTGLLKRMLSALAGNKQAFSGGFASLFSGMGGGGASGGTGGVAPSIGSWFGGGGGLPGASGSMIGPEYGTGAMLQTGAGGGTNWAGIAGGGAMAVGGALGWAQSLKSGSKVGATISGATTGAGIGTMIMPGIGTAIGAGAGAIAGFASSMFGGNKEHKQVNDLRDAYISAAGGLATLGERARKSGLTLDALLKAKTVKDYEAAIASLNDKLATTAAMERTLAGLQGQLAARQVMDLQAAEEITAKYGGTLGNLGQQFEAAKAQASFKTVLDDYERLIDMGGDVGGSLFMMKEEIGALAGESKRIGTEIPAQFEPLIKELIRTHQLFTDTGEEITDISTLKFGAPLESEADTIKNAIMELVQALKDQLLPTIDRIPKTINVHTGYTYDPYEPPDGGSGGVSENGGGGGDGTDPNIPGHAAGALITSPHVAMVGEGGEPELIGPVGFMADALAGALARLGAPTTSSPSDRALADLVQILRQQAATAPAALAPAQPLTVNIHAMDPVGLKRVVEDEVAPLLVSAYGRNVHGLRTATRRELVE